MTIAEHFERRSLLLLVAGIKGAIGSTLAVAATSLSRNDPSVVTSLTTRELFAGLLPVESLHVAGWDLKGDDLSVCVDRCGVVPDAIWKANADALADITVFGAPGPGTDLDRQVDRLCDDIASIRSRYPDSLTVMANLLPAAPGIGSDLPSDLPSLSRCFDSGSLPDLAYVMAALRTGVPVINFTPNIVEFDPVVDIAVQNGVPICGRDGKTGQTYFKVVLASALKARGLYVDGWYSMNILGNEDGENLMLPDRATGKLANKTDLLDRILGYPVGERYGRSTHKVHIDYYPPRGDAKEAWDVIDILGMFGLPMSLRMDLQGRDSILAAPLVIDLARWMAVLQMTGRRGIIPELAFFFKRCLGDDAPQTFPDQLAALERLEADVANAIG